MDNYNEALVKTGVRVMAKRLHPSSNGIRISYLKPGEEPVVIKGPFTESNNLIAGFILIDLNSIEPTGVFENDSNVTDKKFPGNLTRSYRSQEPLKIIGEETEWAKLTTTERREWRENLAKSKGEIIN